MIYKAQINEKIRKIFEPFKDSMVWSCLDKIMGEIYTDNEEKTAVAIIADFCFLAGEPKAEFVQYVPKDYVILVPQDKEWSQLIEEVWGKKAQKFNRYATKKEITFDIDKLKNAPLPEGYEARPIDKEMFEYCKNTKWCSDFVSQYDSFQQYENLGLGVVVTKDGVPVSGASSYSAYKGGIEIQVDTLPQFRRQGLAYFASASLILECISRGIFPSWDAHNLTSLNLATKLGYIFSHSYTAYEIYK